MSLIRKRLSQAFQGAVVPLSPTRTWIAEWDDASPFQRQISIGSDVSSIMSLTPGISAKQCSRTIGAPATDYVSLRPMPPLKSNKPSYSVLEWCSASKSHVKVPLTKGDNWSRLLWRRLEAKMSAKSEESAMKERMKVQMPQNRQTKPRNTARERRASAPQCEAPSSARAFVASAAKTTEYVEQSSGVEFSHNTMAARQQFPDAGLTRQTLSARQQLLDGSLTQQAIAAPRRLSYRGIMQQAIATRPQFSCGGLTQKAISDRLRPTQPVTRTVVLPKLSETSLIAEPDEPDEPISPLSPPLDWNGRKKDYGTGVAHVTSGTNDDTTPRVNVRSIFDFEYAGRRRRSKGRAL